MSRIISDGVRVGGAGTGVSVGGTGVSVGGTGVSVGGTGVLAGGTGALAGGTGVSAGGGDWGEQPSKTTLTTNNVHVDARFRILDTMLSRGMVPK